MKKSCSKLVLADWVTEGQTISIPPTTVTTITSGGPDNLWLIFRINDEKSFSMLYPRNRPLIIHDDEPDDMPDEAEIMDRLTALVAQPGPVGSNINDVLAYLFENQVIDIARLIEITNDLGPVDADIFGEPVRSCRVCGCTDDDCSQCIEATGEPCHWVGEDLCSRCLSDKIDDANNELLSDIKQNLGKLKLEP